MSISLRLLLGYFLIVGLAAWFVLNSFVQEVKPGVRQTMEETLVDTAHLLAELAAEQERIRKALQEMQEKMMDGQSTTPGDQIPGKMEQTEMDSDHASR